MSETTSLVNNVVDKFGNGMDRLMTDTEKLATEFVKRVDTIAPQIAADLKAIGLYAWKCLVRQQIAEGIFYTIAGISLLITLWFFIKFVVKPCYHNGNFEDPYGGVTVLSIFIFPGCIIGSGFLLFYGITHLISPEYCAVVEILNKIKDPQNPHM